MQSGFLCNLHTCYIFISSSLSHIPLSEKDLESLGWDDLIAQKRQLTSELKELSDKIIDIDKNQFRSIGNTIKEQRSILDIHTERLKQIKSEVDSRNSESFLGERKVITVKELSFSDGGSASSRKGRGFAGYGAKESGYY